MNDLTVEEALDFVQSLLEQKGLSMNDNDRRLFPYIWNWKPDVKAPEQYEQITKEINLHYSYSYTTIQRDHADHLRKLLKEVFGAPITNKTLKEVVQREFNRRSQGVYVERPPIEAKCYDAIETPGGLICIKAPQKMGTGKLIGKICHKAESNNYRIVQLDFWEWEAEDEDTYSKFIFWFCQRVSNDLNLSITESMQADMKGNAYCYDYFSNHILPQIKIDSALVLILSSVDRIFSYDFAENFFGLLRSWYNYGKSLEKWQKLRLILTYNTEVYVIIDAAMSPFNVGEKIELLEFNIGQIKDFATQYNLNLNDCQVENLMSYIGGHPYLVDKAIKEITRLKSSFNSEGDFVKEAISRESLEKICKDHLKDLWNQLHRSTEQSREIMIQIIKKILDEIEEETIEIKNIDNDLKKALFLLESLGLIVKNDDQVKFRNNLYREYFRKKF